MVGCGGEVTGNISQTVADDLMRVFGFPIRYPGLNTGKPTMIKWPNREMQSAPVGRPTDSLNL
jgi:hypothetical protein